MVLLFQKNKEILHNQEELLYSQWIMTHTSIDGFYDSHPYSKIVQHCHAQNSMVVGEALVFLVLVAIGVWQVNRAFDKELRLNRQQKNFLLSVTHELKSPIASTKMSLQTMSRHTTLDVATSAKLIHNSLADINRLQTLVENLLLAARIEDRHVEVTPTKFSLSSLVNETWDKYLSAFGHVYTFQSHVDDNIMISADKAAISSIIHNLADNAMKYSPPGSIISIEATNKGKEALIRISDTGPGIPEEEKEFIFKKFYRIGNEDTRQTKGTGLGLYIVKKMLEVHQGSITVRNNTPQGTIFDITIPLHT